MCAVLPRAAFISTARIDFIRYVLTTAVMLLPTAFISTARIDFIRYVLTTAVMLLQTAFMVGWIAVLYSGYFWIQARLLMSMYM